MAANIFIYYGAKMDKVDYENLTKKHGIMNLYGEAYSKGLTFRDIGEIGNGKYIVGKEIAWNRNDIISITRKEDEFVIDENNNNLKLSIEEENNIRVKLLELNISEYPKYYVFICWD